ncbi:hypothetical protein Daesc_003394 [Daldinia eschscholtzii]|uniref:Uncharacterized protein n=1 Tax=Daldinia eschscholtzii TaxID=292717 RepID=A0AAX6MSV5_9PEZI
MASTPFRFLDLAPELRDSVYHEVISTLLRSELKATRVHQGPSVQSKFVPVLRRRSFNTAILFVNRQISQEATEVMVKHYLFVHIATYGVNLSHVLYAWAVPIVAIGKDVIGNFKGFVMSHTIKIQGANPVPENHFMMLQKDFKVFCEALIWLQPSPDNFAHHVVLRNPFKDTASVNWFSPSKQELLVQPYREHLNGIADFNIEGDISPTLATTVTEAVNREIRINPWLLLEAMTNEKAAGDSVSHFKSAPKAVRIWKKAAMQIGSLANSRRWQQMKEDSNDIFAHRMAELLFWLHLQQINSLTFMIYDFKRRGNLERARSYWSFMLEAISGSFFGVANLGTTWTPQNRHNGLRFFRLATAYRILERSPQIAQEFIELADMYLPGNRRINEERERIDSWVDSLGVLGGMNWL